MGKVYRYIIFCGYLICGLFLFQAARAQTTPLQEIYKENADAVKAIALYPEEIRLAILEVSKHPELIVNIASLQQKTSSQFKKLVGDLTQSQQKAIWELVRYPELLQALHELDKPSEQELKKILQKMPEKLQAEIIGLKLSKPSVIDKTYELMQAFDADVVALTADYPKPVQNAVKELIQLPDVMYLLSGHLEVTVLVGDAFKRNPEKIIHQLDSLNIALAEENAKAVAAWKKLLEDNAKATEELAAAAKEYAEEYGYDPYKTPETPDNRTVQQVRYVYRVYPYCFGYPWWYWDPWIDIEWDIWYPDPWWYPYPFWYHTGFYFAPDGTIVIVGLPSYHFVCWYFFHHHHHYYYPHLSDIFIVYYKRFPSYHNSIHRGVGEWLDYYGPRVASGWLNDDANRVERFRQLGKMEIDYQQYASKKRKPLDRKEYLSKNINRYPALEFMVNEFPERVAKSGYDRKYSIADELYYPWRKRFPELLPADRETIFKTPREVPGRPQTNVRFNGKITTGKTVVPKIIQQQDNINRAKDLHFQQWNDKSFKLDVKEPVIKPGPAYRQKNQKKVLPR